MDSAVPSRKSDQRHGFSVRCRWLLAICSMSSLLFNIGCAALSIPSYRLNESAGYGHYDELANCDSTECEQAIADHQSSMASECDEPSYSPMLPALPTPKFVKRWKEQRNLPDGPKGVKFHPLPTRPMFRPKPGSTPFNPDWMCDPLEASDLADSTTMPSPTPNFGTIPQRSQWEQIRQAEGVQPSEPTHSPSQAKPQSSATPDELPSPATRQSAADDSES